MGEISEDCCRICLTITDLSESISTMMIDQLPVIELIEGLFGYQVDPVPGSPQKICQQCKARLKGAYELKSLVYDSDFRIQEFLTKEVSDSEEEDAVSFLLGNIRNQKVEEEKDNTEAELEEKSIDINDQKEDEQIQNDAHEYAPQEYEFVANSKVKTIDLIVPERVEYQVNEFEPTPVIEPSKSRKYACTLCPKTFVKRSNLIDHLHLHANIRQYHCTMCPKKFTQKGNLVAHVRCHTDDRPYVCQYCEKRFTQGTALKIHIRSHTNEKNYVCEICTKGFTNKSDLAKHAKVHDTNKDFACGVCEKEFTQKVHARSHITRKHEGYKIEDVLIDRRKLGKTNVDHS